MTIASATSRIGYTGDGVTTAFAVPFYFAANADLVVTAQDLSGNVTTKLLGTDYNLTGATLSTGGTCTFVVAPTTGFKIAIYRVPQITQTTSYNNNDPFPAKSHELALDKLTTIDQYLKTQIDRAILVASTDNPPMTTLPPASVRALKNLSFDSLGNPTATAPATGAAVSSPMIPVVTASTLAIARGILSVREVLTASRTYYVLKTGSNSNTGTANTAGGAWLTIQYALDYVSQYIDLGTFALTIQVGDGTYAENVILPGVIGLGKLAQASAIIQGNAANHSAVIIQPASGDAIVAVDTLSGWTIKNIQLHAVSANVVRADYNSSIYLDGVVFAGAGTVNIHAQATYGGSFIEFINNPYVVASNSLAHAISTNGGQVVWQPAATCSFTGIPSCATAWLVIIGGGMISPGAVFNGLTATGAGVAFSIDYGGSLRTSNDLNPNAVLPAGLLPGTVNIWPVQGGISFTNLLNAVKVNLQVTGRATHGDSNYVILASDAPFIQTSVALTGARTWQLPLSNSLPPGSLLTVQDGGAINGANTLTIVRQSSDTFIGIGTSANAITLGTATGSLTVRNDGTTGWYLVGKT